MSVSIVATVENRVALLAIVLKKSAFNPPTTSVRNGPTGPIAQAVAGDAAKPAGFDGLRASFAANRLRALRISLVASCLFGSCAVAQDFRVLSVDSPNPGTVSVSIQGAGAATNEKNFSMQIGGAGPIAAERLQTASVAPQPTALVICIDKSGSMGSATIENVKTALIEFLGRARPGLDVGIIGFGSATKTVVGFGATPQVIADRLHDLAPESRDSKTKLYEAISGGIDQLRSVKDRAGKRLLVISDGKDEGSDTGLERVVEKARDNGVVIDAIGAGRLAPSYSSSLVSIADRTGGSFVPVTSADGIGPAFENIVGTFATPKVATRVTFVYPVDADGRKVGNAVLQYARAGAAPVSQTVTGEFALPAAESSMPGRDEAKRVDLSATERLKMIINFKFPLVPIAACLLLAAILLWLALMMLRKPPKAPPPVVVPPPHRDTGPGPVVPPPVVPPSGAGRVTRVASHAFPAPGPGRPTALLKGLSGPVGASTVRIETPVFRIGADPASQLAIAGDEFLSSDHAQIRYDSGSLYLDDRKSSNGTFLNGTRLTQVPMPLKLGDEIRVGKSTMVLQAGAGSQPAGPLSEGSIA